MVQGKRAPTRAKRPPEWRSARALKPWFKSHLPAGVTYDLFHHQSKSDLNLQVADYVSWAVYKKWTDGDLRSYDLVKKCIRSEGDLFKGGDRTYY